MYINTRAAALFGALPPNSIQLEEHTLSKNREFAAKLFWGYFVCWAASVEILKYF